MKRTYLTITFVFVVGFFTTLLAQYRVQVAAFVESVPRSYFADRGLEGVMMQTDQNFIHRYYLSDFIEREMAEEKLKSILPNFPNAHIIDIEKQKSICGKPCPYMTEHMTFVNEIDDELYLRIIYFGFNKSSISWEGQQELNDLYETLISRDDFKIKILGHTDAIGSAKYNIALSKRRTRAVKNYLIAKGISAYRIKSIVFGEAKPIAVNEFEDGRDSIEGRRYNRRAVIVITSDDGQILADMEGMINVPDYLKVRK